MVCQFSDETASEHGLLLWHNTVAKQTRTPSDDEGVDTGGTCHPAPEDTLSTVFYRFPTLIDRLKQHGNNNTQFVKSFHGLIPEFPSLQCQQGTDGAIPRRIRRDSGRASRNRRDGRRQHSTNTHPEIKPGKSTKLRHARNTRSWWLTLKDL